MDRYAFGNRICALRTQYGYTQEKLGKILGVSNKAVSKWENGTTQPRLQMLEKLAACFDMSVEQLLEYESEKPEVQTEIPNKPINTDIPEEIDKSPQLSVKMLFGFGFLKIDVQKFLREIKNKYSLTNSDISTILHTSERKIGLWENGLKQPNPKENLKIAAFYYNNCDDSERLDTFMEVSAGIKMTNITYLAGMTFLAVYFYVFIFPLSVIADFGLTSELLNAFPPFSVSGFFNSVLPVTAMFAGFFVLFGCVKRNMPNISEVLKIYQIFSSLVFVYLVIDWIFVIQSYFMAAIIGFFGLYILIMHLVKDKPERNIFRNVSLIAVALIISAIICKYADYIMAAVEENPDNFIMEKKLFAAFPMLFYMLIAVFEFFYFDSYNYYRRIKKYFPISEAESKSAVISKKDIIIFCAFLLAATVYFIVLEVNRGRLFEWFYLLPDE